MVFDLKEGMIVKLRNGDYAVVANLDPMGNGLTLVQDIGVFIDYGLMYKPQTLEHIDNKNYDIMSVYNGGYVDDIRKIAKSKANLIWNRVTNSDFSKLKVDTKILVNGKPAYFSYYNEVSGKVYYFADGLSNWTASIFHSKPIVDICDPEDVEVIEEFD